MDLHESRPRLFLSEREAQVWILSDREALNQWCELSRFLSPEESRRAELYHTVRDGKLFRGRRGMLRVLLAGFLGCRPEEVGLTTGAHGKPQLADPGNPPLYFNLSRTIGLALFAFARGAEIGVDVEHRSTDVDQSAVGGVVFSPSELAAMERRGDDALGTFFRLWTRKEAVLKALGVGLGGTADARTLEVSEAPPHWEVIVEGRQTGGEWTIRELNLGAAWHANVAVVADGFTCRLVSSPAPTEQKNHGN